MATEEKTGVSDAIKLHNIGIDMELHRIIEMNRADFNEAPHEILKRILSAEASRVNESTVASVAAKREENKAAAVAREASQPQRRMPVHPAAGRGKAWEKDGAVVPHGSEARFVYGRGKQVIEGKFFDGRLVVDGMRFDNLSEAANAVASTRQGKKTRLNGWAYWQVKRPGDSDFRVMDELRHGPAIKTAKTAPRAAAQQAAHA